MSGSLSSEMSSSERRIERAGEFGVVAGGRRRTKRTVM